MEAGSIVVLHLIEPAEKYWGQVLELTPAGVTLRSINLDSIEDWIRTLAYEEELSGLGLATIFFPLRRVERMFLDEPVGQIESLRQGLERRVGKSLEELMGVAPPTSESTD